MRAAAPVDCGRLGIGVERGERVCGATRRQHCSSCARTPMRAAAPVNCPCSPVCTAPCSPLCTAHFRITTCSTARRLLWSGSAHTRCAAHCARDSCALGRRLSSNCAVRQLSFRRTRGPCLRSTPRRTARCRPWTQTCCQRASGSTCQSTRSAVARSSWLLAGIVHWGRVRSHWGRVHRRARSVLLCSTTRTASCPRCCCRRMGACALCLRTAHPCNCCCCWVSRTRSLSPERCTCLPRLLLPHRRCRYRRRQRKRRQSRRVVSGRLSHLQRHRYGVLRRHSSCRCRVHGVDARQGSANERDISIERRNRRHNTIMLCRLLALHGQKAVNCDLGTQERVGARGGRERVCRIAVRLS